MTVQDCIDTRRDTAASFRKEAERASPNFGNFISSMLDKASGCDHCDCPLTARQAEQGAAD